MFEEIKERRHFCRINKIVDGVEKDIDEVDIMLDEDEAQRAELLSDLFPNGVQTSDDMVKEFLHITQGVIYDD